MELVGREDVSPSLPESLHALNQILLFLLGEPHWTSASRGGASLGRRLGREVACIVHMHCIHRKDYDYKMITYV